MVSVPMPFRQPQTTSPVPVSSSLPGSGSSHSVKTPSIGDRIKIAGIIGAVIVIAILVTSMISGNDLMGMGTGHSMTSSSQVKAVSPTPAITLLPTQALTSVPTATPENGLKTYTNSQYGFAVDYPASWKTLNNGDGIVTFSPSTSPTVNIDVGHKNSELQDYFLTQVKKVQSNPDAQITNHDFKCSQGYRIDYIVTKSGSTSRTKITKIFTEGHSDSQVFILAYTGGENGYTSEVVNILKSFRLTNT